MGKMKDLWFDALTEICERYEARKITREVAEDGLKKLGLDWGEVACHLDAALESRLLASGIIHGEFNES